MLLLILATCFLAYANGANDNFKGVASLFGSGTTSYRTAITWATVTTFGGSICAMFLAQTLLKKFSGKGLVPEAIVGSEHFLLAVALGAGATVIVATWAGFPVSTTHGLTGAMIGSGLMAAGWSVNFQALGKGFLLPLLLSPVLAVLLAAPLYLVAHHVRLRLKITKGAGYEGAVLGMPAQRLVDATHFLSAGIVSFARGLNDAPKIAAMLMTTVSGRICSGRTIRASGITDVNLTLFFRESSILRLAVLLAGINVVLLAGIIVVLLLGINSGFCPEDGLSIIKEMNIINRIRMRLFL